jgi:hypothetical protein
VTGRKALDKDFDFLWEDDPCDSDGQGIEMREWRRVRCIPGRQVADPAPAADVQDLLRDHVDGNRWDQPEQAHWDGSPPPAPADAPSAAPSLITTTSTLTSIGTWEPMPEYHPRPWYRTKPAMIALIGAAAVAIVVSVVLALRNPEASSEQSPTIAPSTYTQPTPSTVQPAPSSTPPIRASASPPPAAPRPPPPPPTTAQEPVPAPDGGGGSTLNPYPRQTPPPTTAQNPVPAPDGGGGSNPNPYPRQAPPSRTNKPEIGVTRAPISVAPTPRPAPSNDNAKPGEQPRRSWLERAFGIKL